MVDYFSEDTDRYMNIVKHIYLNSAMVDVVIRICAVQGLVESRYEKIDMIRVEILQTLSNALEHTYDDSFMTEQIFAILTGLVKKCYIMGRARSLFEEMYSPFVLKPVLDFTFQEMPGVHTTLGAEFLSLSLYNLYIADPSLALQDMMEANFGFSVLSIAGMTVDQGR